MSFNLITPNLNSSKNFFNVSKTEYKKNLVIPKLNDLNIKHDIKETKVNPKTDGFELVEKEYTFEELMADEKQKLQSEKTSTVNYKITSSRFLSITFFLLKSLFNKLDGVTSSIQLEVGRAVFAEKIVSEIATKLEFEELSKALTETALNEHNIQSHRKEYEWFSNMEWCAQYATWVYENTDINGKSAAEIAGLTYNLEAGEEWTPSTGRLMMHFYTADNPELGFDYTKEPYYKGKNSNIGFFYNDYSSIYEGKNSQLGKVTTEEKYIPKPGNFIFFNHGGGDTNQVWEPNKSGFNSVQDHTGLVLDVKTDDNGNLIELTTLEGNISDSHYTRTIKFDGTDPYSEYVIGYGAITNIQ